MYKKFDLNAGYTFDEGKRAKLIPLDYYTYLKWGFKTVHRPKSGLFQTPTRSFMFSYFK
jgi:hypothetical protein